MPTNNDLPPGFSLKESLAAVVHQLDSEDAVARAHVSASQVLDELAQSDPEFAASRRKHQREMKAWRRGRNRLAKEVALLEVPLFVAALHDHGPAGEAAAVVLRVTKYLFENEAPAELLRDLLRTTANLTQADYV